VVTTLRRWRASAALTCALAVVLSAALAGCNPNSGPGGSAASPGATQSGAAAPSGDPTTASPLAACVAQVDGRLTLAQRVGQLFLVGLSADAAGPVTTAALQQYHFGSLLFAMNTSEGVTAAAAATAHMQSLATASITGGVRFFIAANQEGGQVQNLTGPGFSVMPPALIQGTMSVSKLREQAAIWGGQLKAAGVNLDLAPVMDVVPPGTADTNAPIGEVEREFGFDPQTNGTHGAAFIAGMASAGVATSAKHFPGLGRVTGNTDYTPDVVDTVTTADDPYLGSFRAAIDAGVPFVMVALATYTKIDPSTLAVFSPVVMRLLRSKLGFNGVIISDDLGEAAAVSAIPAQERAIDFLSAGGDMITSQTLAPAETMASAVLARATADPSFRSVVNAAVLRILAAKMAYGLLPC
jgi:beta-N-acetylhexosaminidase